MVKLLSNTLRRLRNCAGRLRGAYIRRRYKCAVPPGHYSSPIPSLRNPDTQRHFEGPTPESLYGIDLNGDEQLCLLEDFARFYGDLPYGNSPDVALRYTFQNTYYRYADAITLYCMIRHLRPRRIVEVGSGYSSCVILDTNETFFDNSITCSFIEPYPNRLLQLIRPGDLDRICLVRTPVQHADLGIIESLECQDILLIDSTHVSKAASDVNYLLFEVLPRLAGGVYIHFHDVFYPFEYPLAWLQRGDFWNEAYVLRAFLQYNLAFKVVFFTTWLAAFHSELLASRLPLFVKNTGGSIWLRKEIKAEGVWNSSSSSASRPSPQHRPSPHRPTSGATQIS